MFKLVSSYNYIGEPFVRNFKRLKDALDYIYRNDPTRRMEIRRPNTTWLTYEEIDVEIRKRMKDNKYTL